MDKIQVKRAYPLIIVLVFGSIASVLWINWISPMLLHEVEGFEVPCMILTLLGMVAFLSTLLHKTGAFED